MLESQNCCKTWSISFTQLYLATQLNQTHTVEQLTKHGADVGSPTKRYIRPIHVAAENGFITMILLDHGADLNVQDSNQSTPLHLATQKNQTEMVVKHGANMEIWNEEFLRAITFYESPEEYF